MNKIIADFLNKFNSLNKYFVVVIILLVGFTSIHLNGNEEQYMGLAKSFMDPDWMPQSLTFHEFPGTRILYQIIVGTVLKFLSFNSTLLILRILLVAVISIPLAKLYRQLEIDNIHVFFQLAGLYLVNQSLFAGSFIFISVEPKCFSYVFIFWAIYFFLKNKPGASTASLILATYFHFLVGFFVAFYLFASLSYYVFKKETPLRGYIKNVLFYLLAIIPVVVYLTGAVASKENFAFPSSDWIYTYFRSPNHTALFLSPSYFHKEHFYGILWTLIGLIFAILFLKDTQKSISNRVTVFTIVTIIGTVMFLPFIFFDREGVILKYYLFRINAVSTFFLSVIIVRAYLDFTNIGWIKRMRIVIFMISFLGLIKISIPNAVLNYRILFETNNDLISCTNYLRDHTPTSSIVMSFIDDLRISRLSQRDRLAVYKFVPADFSKIQDWYSRLQYRDSVLQHPEQLLDENKYGVDYCLTEHSLGKEFPDPVFSSGNYFIYEIPEMN